MRDAWYWFMFTVMLTSCGLNIWGFVLSMRTVKRARKSWKRASEVSDALAE